jgi:endoglucanase Acf2
MFKSSFLPREKKDPKSIKKKLPMKRQSEYLTTTNLTTVEWEEYIQNIRDTVEPIVGKCPVPEL